MVYEDYGNGHSIHDDHPYVTGVAGYPGLIAHVPLQAMLLAAHALAQAPGPRLKRFSFRGVRACLDGRGLTLLARHDAGRILLETRDAERCACMAAEADLAPAVAR